jgi:GNAT superfamily N-acetyltransferase
MAWVLTDELDRLLCAAGKFLRQRAASNTIVLTVAETVRARGDAAYGDQAPLFGWWQEADGSVGGAFLHTPPHPAVLTSMRAGAAAALAGSLAGRGRFPGGVSGGVETAHAFAAAWQDGTGQVASVHRRERLYRLGELSVPDPAPPGFARQARPADRGLLIAWVEAFGQEAGEGAGAADKAVDDRLSYGGLTLWEADGRPVSLAGLTRPAAGQVRVGPVYTPPELRRRGFAAAVTSAVSQAALDAGAAEVLLFTDLANPTSNGIYQRLGYRPVEDRVVLLFRPRNVPPEEPGAARLA